MSHVPAQCPTNRMEELEVSMLYDDLYLPFLFLKMLPDQHCTSSIFRLFWLFDLQNVYVLIKYANSASQWYSEWMNGHSTVNEQNT